MSWPARAGLAAIPLVLACHSAQPEARPAADACSARTGRLPPTVTADRLAGQYRVRLVATSGPRRGAEIDGRLLLRPMHDSLRVPPPLLGVRDSTTSYPLIGSTDLDPEAIGATRTGDLASLNALAPGVLVIERHRSQPDAPAEILLRLGAEANRRGVLRYDGGYFALTVRHIAATSFAGTWASGISGPAAEGYFCAERAGP